jgi:hypothetical protein
MLGVSTIMDTIQIVVGLLQPLTRLFPCVHRAFLSLLLQLVRSSRESTEAHTAQLAAAAAALRTAEEETASHKTAHAKRIAEIETLKLQLASLQSAAAQRERALSAANAALEVCGTCHRFLLHC